MSKASRTATCSRRRRRLGPRESRQISGPYALTGDDVHAGRKFDDAIARGSWWIDIHCPLGNTYPVHLCVKECPKEVECPFWAAEHDTMRSKKDLYPPRDDWYEIPYRSLLSVGVPNLLAVGALYLGNTRGHGRGACDGDVRGDRPGSGGRRRRWLCAGAKTPARSTSSACRQP